MCIRDRSSGSSEPWDAPSADASTTTDKEGGPEMGWLDKLRNKRDETKGAAKEHVGKATGDKKMEREGKTDQTKSNLKPVSYTHLRAHETVLDLVCRLLLEKKKKNPNITLSC